MPASTGRLKKQDHDSKDKKKVVKLEKKETANKKAAVKKTTVKKPEPVYDPEKLVFALDIGTRSVVGVVGVQEEERFRIVATEVVEHKSRAMLDGQIHDIDMVAEVVRQVKDKIELRLGVKLEKVAIAAAGRVLKTALVRVDRDLDPTVEIDAETVGSIEIEGIQRAQLMLDRDFPAEASDDEKTSFYCVGYSIVNYYLNGFVISKLTGHKGKSAGADVLATFLPHIVVDSLYTVMNRVGLDVASLTLEPIAAINVTIPPDLRLLNLALVDIGAGTSDIAITKNGSIVAYAMAPVAGDEITERIEQQYLVDFNTAEKIKTALATSKGSISFIDILNVKHSVEISEVASVVKPSVEQLAATISQKILEYNGKAPNAVFLIGGGSQIPGLPSQIAERLELPVERIAVRGRDVIRNVKFLDKKLAGPESITPYGIAVTAQMHKGRDFMTVTLNGNKIKLFNSRKLTVADALMLMGFNPAQLIGRTGRSLNFTLNGEKRVIRGDYGQAAEITVNQSPAHLETYIRYGDEIDIVPAVDGNDAKARIMDVVSHFRTVKVVFDGRQVDISTKILVNGRQVSPETQIQENDNVEIRNISTLKELLEITGMKIGDADIAVNGRKESPEYMLKNSDVIESHAVTEQEANIGQPVQKENQVHKEQPVQGLLPALQKLQSGVQIEPQTAKQEQPSAGKGNGIILTVNGEKITMKDSKSQHIFVDVFNYISFDLSKPQGNIVLKLNGQSAAFTDIVKTGDMIEIYWQK